MTGNLTKDETVLLLINLILYTIITLRNAGEIIRQ